MDDVCLDTTIVELSEIENLNNRVINICKYNNLNNLFQILYYYVLHGHFLNIRNFGIQTSNELVQISKKYMFLYPSNIAVNNGLPDLELNLPLIELPIKRSYTHLQKTIITNFINVKIRLVSVRLKNILSKYLHDDYSFDTFERLILLTPKDKFKYFNGLGENSFVELKNLVDSVNEYIDTVMHLNETESLLYLYSTYLQRSFRIEYEDVLQITSGYDFTRGIPIFKTVFYLSKLKKILDRTERSLFFSDNYRYVDFTAENLYFELFESAVTRERIRQVNRYLPSKLRECVIKIFSGDLKDYSFNTYSFDRQSDFIHIDHKQLEEIRSTESVSFTQQFVTFILSVLYIDTHFLLGDDEWFYPHQRRCRYFEWQNFYLINRRFENIFNFRQFVISLSELLSDKKQELLNDTKDFRLFLKQFFLIDDYSEIDSIADICELIIHVEFP